MLDLAEMKTRFKADRAAGMDATYQFDITGDEGGQFNAVIADGAVEFNEGQAEKPDVTLTTTADDWNRLYNGQLNPQMAFMVGKLKVKGNIGLATKLGSLFL